MRFKSRFESCPLGSQMVWVLDLTHDLILAVPLSVRQLVFAYPPRAVSSGCGFKGLAGRAVPLMEEDVVAAPSQCSRGRKRKAWEACESVTRETTKSLRQCGIDWLKSKQFVHHPLSSSSFLGLRRIATEPYGDCQFLAIIHSAQLPFSAQQLRHRIVQYLKPLSGWFSDRMENQFRGRCAAWCSHMAQPHIWGD